MKPFSSQLAALFQTRTFVSADLYTFTLPGGIVIALTSADRALTWNGVTYLSGAPALDRSAITQKTGLQVSSVKINVYPAATDLIAGSTWFAALRRGSFDGASVEIDRAFASAWGQPVTGVITMLKGRVADATFGRSKAEIEVNSWTELLSNQMPRTYYQSACNNTLGDARCGIDRALYSEAGALLMVDSAAVLMTTLPAPQNWFAYGYLTMTSGVCANESRPIIFNSGPIAGGNQLALQVPLTVPPSVGDTFIAYPGCDKTVATCRSKFDNIGRYTGYPFIPAPETAV